MMQPPIEIAVQAASILLRPATPDDEPFLFHLFAADKIEEFKAVGLAGAQVDALIAMQNRGRAMSYSAAFPTARSWIAERADDPVARLLEADQAGCLHIVDIAVVPRDRRLGIGRSIVETLQIKAKSLGKGVSAKIFVENQASRALFAALGFVESAQPGEAYLDVGWRP